MLNRLGVSATLRRTMGDDVEGACGQLRNRELKEAKESLPSGYKTHAPKKKEKKAEQKNVSSKEKTYKKEEKKNPRQRARFNEKSNSNRTGRHR